MAIEAIQSGTKRITDEDIESSKPALEEETIWLNAQIQKALQMRARLK